MTNPFAHNRLPILAAEINQAIANAEKQAGASIANAIAAGEKFVEAKCQLQHGEWLPWLRQNCGLSERQAQKYMRLARNREVVDANAPSKADLSIDAVLDAIAERRSPLWPAPGSVDSILS